MSTKNPVDTAVTYVKTKLMEREVHAYAAQLEREAKAAEKNQSQQSSPKEKGK